MDGAVRSSSDLNCRIQLISNIKNFVKDELDGLIIMRYDAWSSEEILSVAENIPVVVINRFINEGQVGYISIDNTMESFKAVEYLIKQGHSRIAFIGNCCSDGLLRRRGYLSALKTYGISVDENLIISRNPANNLFDEIKKILGNPEISAVLAASGNYFLNFLNPVLRELKVRIPKDLSIICFDDIETDCFHDGPPLTCVRMPLEQMGRAALEGLANCKGNMIREKFHAELVIRQSCRDMNQPGIIIEGESQE